MTTYNNDSTAAADVLLTETEVAARQRRAVKTLRNERVNGGGVPFLKLGRLVRYRLSDVVDWENSRLATSTSDRARLEQTRVRVDAKTGE